MGKQYLVINNWDCDYNNYNININLREYIHQYYVSFIKYFLLYENINYIDVINIYSFLDKPNNLNELKSINGDDIISIVNNKNDIYTKLIKLLFNHIYRNNNLIYSPLVYLYSFFMILINYLNKYYNFNKYYKILINKKNNLIKLGLHMIIYIFDIENKLKIEKKIFIKVKIK